MTLSHPSSTPTNTRPTVWCALTLILLSATIAMAATEGPPIASIRVESPTPIDRTSIAEVLELEVGKPLDRRRLREVIMVLYAGGQVEWLRVESAQTPDGLDVVVHISYQSTVSQIKVRTKSPLLRVKIQRWLKIEVGDPVTVASVEANRRRVERRLHDRGYADATIEAYLEYNRKANTVIVEFDVKAGAPQVVGSVVIDGLDDPEVAAAAMPKFKEGARLTTRLEEKLRTRTEASLRTMGYWEAEVLNIERHADGADVELAIRVEAGSRYRLELETPEASLKIAQNAFPDPAKEELHPAQTEALVERVQERLQEFGYLMAEVSAELAITAGELVLHLKVDPGPKLKVAAIEFPGADLMSRRQLESAVLVKPGKVGGRFSQQISNATLKADRQAIEDLYRSEGFPDVVVEEPEILPAEKEGAVQIVFAIEEGARWSIVEFRLEGVPVETATELESNPIGVVEGTPWSPAAVERADRRVEEALADTGYPDGRAEVEVDTSVAGKAVVIMRVEPGPFVRVGSVVIAGLRHTREKLVAGVIRRAGVQPGEPLSRRRMLDAQRGLYELGLFRRVELVPMPGQEHRVERNIVVRCEEGEQKSYLFGVGYSNVDAARLILGWSHLNLFGGAHAFSAEVSLSQNQQRYSLSWREKRTLGLDIPSYLAIYRTDERIADRDLLRRGLWIDFGDRLKQPLRPWFRYEYEIIQPESLPPGVPVANFDFPEETKVASITPSIEWDTRDNPLAPRKGVFASASLQYAFPAFQADEHFLKMQTGATVYRPIWRGFGAIGLRLGAIRPFDQIEGIQENLQIPFAYRFFAGGRTTHRAFGTDDLGIPDQTIVNGSSIGGNALILFNIEYQRRIEGPFFAVIFIDAGNVWASPSDVRVGDVRWGAGLGLHYLTPAGPLRAEYGWKLDRQEGEPGGKFFVSFGVPF